MSAPSPTAAGVPQGIDPVWRQIAQELASALRPYSLFREQRLHDGRVVVETAVPASTLAAANIALEHLATQIANESRRAASTENKDTRRQPKKIADLAPCTSATAESTVRSC